MLVQSITMNELNKAIKLHPNTGLRHYPTIVSLMAHAKIVLLNLYTEIWAKRGISK